MKGLSISLATAALGVAVLAAPVANADSVSYLDFLTEHDLIIEDASDAISVGYGVCSSIDGGYSPEEVGMWLYGNLSWATTQDAATIVVAAVYHICPEFKYLFGSNSTARTKEKGMAV